MKIFTTSFSSVYPLYMAKVMQKIRYLDKLADELARGKTLRKVLRT